MAMNKIIFDDEITIWWQEETIPSATRLYKLYLDGELHGETTKTHYTFSDLFSSRAYQVRLEKYERGVLKGKNEYIFRTQKAKKRMDITKEPYNAVGDGKTLNTAAIQRALDDCTKKDRVYIPAGEFLTGALNVHGDTELYLCENAILRGSTDEKDYLPKIKSRFEGMNMSCYRSLLNMGELDSTGGYNCENVIVRGKGTIFGGGLPLATAIIKKEKAELKEYLAQNAGYVKTCETTDTIPGRARGRLLNMSNCKNVIVSGLTLGYGASWNVHFVYSRDIITYDCKILSDTIYNDDGTVKMESVWNGDGWDPDSSENCVLFDTEFYTYDNAIAIKSGKNPDGNIINRPTKNVFIFDCRGKNDFAIGSEISGGVEGVYVWDCEFLSSWGINLKTTAARGGYIKNVSVTDSKVASVTIRTRVGFNNDGESAGVLTKISDLRFENLQILGVFEVNGGEPKVIPPIFFDGFDGEGNGIKNVLIRNVRLLPLTNGERKGIVGKNVKNVTLENVSMENVSL